MRREPRTYNHEFVKKAVRMCMDGMPMCRVAEQLDVSAKMVYKWCHAVGYHGMTRAQRRVLRDGDDVPQMRFPPQKVTDREYFAEVLKRLRPVVKEASDEFKRKMIEGNECDRGMWEERKDG